MFGIIAQCHRDLYHFLVEKNKQKLKKCIKQHPMSETMAAFLICFPFKNNTWDDDIRSHSDDESLSLSSTTNFWKMVNKMLAAWAGTRKTILRTHSGRGASMLCGPTREHRKMTMRADCHDWDTAIRPVLDILQDAQYSLPYVGYSCLDSRELCNKQSLLYNRPTWTTRNCQWWIDDYIYYLIQQWSMAMC